MASKIKVDQIQTADGTGTIALQNQLSGMDYSSMPAGSIIQVVSANLSSTTTTTSDADVSTGLALTITPKYANSHIWLTINGGAQGYGSVGLVGVIAFYRNINSAGASSLGYVGAINPALNTGAYQVHSAQLFDTTHNSTASIEYLVYMRSRGPSGTYYFHNSVGGVSGKVVFTAMEVKQ
jgi:hypothetical protein